MAPDATSAVVLADTHGDAGHRLADHALRAVRAADVVFHAGDFTTPAVLEAFQAASARLEAVYGNNDDPAVVDRLPATRTVAALGRRIVLVHGHEHDDTALGLLARQERADLVVSGHSHRPGVRTVDGLTMLNPGSHAEPRWHRPGYATLERDGDRVDGRLLEPDGTLIEPFVVGTVNG